MCNEYSGWSNYETWLANLHLSNDQGDYNRIQEEIEDRKFTTGNNDVYIFSQWLEETYSVESLEDMGYKVELPMFYSDLLSSAYRAINWYEIAKSWIEDYRADNPIKTSEVYKIEYTAFDKYGRFWAESADSDFDNNEHTFWSLFNTIIEHAIDNEYTSIEIVWDFDPKIVTEDWGRIADQHKRNTRV